MIGGALLTNFNNENWCKTLVISDTLVSSDFKDKESEVEELVNGLTEKITACYSNLKFIEGLCASLEMLRTRMTLEMRKHGARLRNWLDEDPEEDFDFEGFFDE